MDKLSSKCVTLSPYVSFFAGFPVMKDFKLRFVGVRASLGGDVPRPH